MLFRETVFDLISFGKSTKIHIATTASLDRTKRLLSEYTFETVSDTQTEAISFKENNDTIFIHSIFNMSYDDFVQNVVPTDLTFNSLLMKSNGQIYDMHNGLQDLKEKKLNFVASFNEPHKTRLVLNCIRYIFKNGFSYTEQVGRYIVETIPHFSKNEKHNALFYFAEHILSNGDLKEAKLLLNNSFLSNDKYPNINVGDYEKTIALIGKERYIYLLIFLLNVNINKTRFGTIINTEDFFKVKDAFEMNLHDEITYYSLKEKYGQEYVSNIILLQKEYAKITNTEYTEPMFNRETVFDFLAQNTETAIFDSEFFWGDEDMGKLADANTADDIKELDNVTTPSLIKDTEDDVKVEAPSAALETALDFIQGATVEDTSPPAANCESDVPNMLQADTIKNEQPDTFAEDTTAKAQFVLSEVEDETDNEATMDNTPITPSTSSNIFDILCEDDDDEENNRFQPKSKKRNINPRFMQSSQNVDTTTESTQGSVVEEPLFTTTTDELTEENETFPATPVIFADVAPQTPAELEDTTYLHPEQDMALPHQEVAKVPVQPVVPVSIEDKKSSLIDNIFEEEVVAPEISLSPEFDDLANKVASQNIRNDDSGYGRKTVDENMMLDVVPEGEEMQSSESTTTEDDDYGTPADFEISEQDLADILAELSGKKKNTFLDDDAPAQENQGEEDIVGGMFDFSQNQSTYVYQPQEDTSAKDDDFFKSLNDDFTEIVGGNGK